MEMKWAKNKQGFTIVELLIVVVVIAILAAITIVSYNGITTKAYLSSVQSDFRNAVQSLEMYKVKNGSLPAANTNTQLASANIQINKSSYSSSVSNFLYCANFSTGVAGIIAVGTDGVTYAQSTQKSFSTFTSNSISDYTGACTALVSSSDARYGFSMTETPQWRAWVNP